jgi:hypothetical protein
MPLWRTAGQCALMTNVLRGGGHSELQVSSLRRVSKNSEVVPPGTLAVDNCLETQDKGDVHA